MTTKLTLSVDEAVIRDAKAYAQGVGRSVSQLVEAYLRALTTEQRVKHTKLPETIKRWHGAFAPGFTFGAGTEATDQAVSEDCL